MTSTEDLSTGREGRGAADLAAAQPAAPAAPIDTQLLEDLEEALKDVVDPELGINIVDLGLVYDISVERGGVVRVSMTTTTRFCPASDFLREAVEVCVASLPGVTKAEVQLTYEPPWTPDRMELA